MQRTNKRHIFSISMDRKERIINRMLDDLFIEATTQRQPSLLHSLLLNDKTDTSPPIPEPEEELVSIETLSYLSESRSCQSAPSSTESECVVVIEDDGETSQELPPPNKKVRRSFSADQEFKTPAKVHRPWETAGNDCRKHSDSQLDHYNTVIPSVVADISNARYGKPYKESSGTLPVANCKVTTCNVLPVTSCNVVPVTSCNVVPVTTFNVVPTENYNVVTTSAYNIVPTTNCSTLPTIDSSIVRTAACDIVPTTSGGIWVVVPTVPQWTLVDTATKKPRADSESKDVDIISYEDSENKIDELKIAMYKEVRKVPPITFQRKPSEDWLSQSHFSVTSKHLDDNSSNLLSSLIVEELKENKSKMEKGLKKNINDILARLYRDEDTTMEEKCKNKKSDKNFNVVASGHDTPRGTDSPAEYGKLEIDLSVKETKTKRSGRKTKGIYECTVCLRVFKNKCNLYRHLKIHRDNTGVIVQDKSPRSGRTMVSCELCSRKFTSEENLLNHERHEHQPEDNIILFNCDLCDEDFLYKFELKRHRFFVHNAKSEAI